MLSHGIMFAGGAALLLLVTPTMTMPFYCLHSISNNKHEVNGKYNHHSQNTLRYSALGPLDT